MRPRPALCAPNQTRTTQRAAIVLCPMRARPALCAPHQTRTTQRAAIVLCPVRARPALCARNQTPATQGARPAICVLEFSACPHGMLIGWGREEQERRAPLKILPALPMSSVMAQKVSEKPSQSPLAIQCLTAKVLIVDDDEHFRILARSILEPGGFEVIESEDVRQCMSQLRYHAVDAVILDMVMPGLDGIEALRELKRLFPEIRIVAVSGAEQSDLYLSVSAHLGADASLAKARIGSLCPLLKVVLDR